MDPVDDEVVLREVREADLPIFFEHQLDPVATRLAAFAPRDRDAFGAHWARILAEPDIVTRTVVYRGEVAGNVVCFERGGLREVGYWIGREYWGRGVATRALAALLARVGTRPLHARVARHNRASIRVLEKCGFRPSDEGPGPGDAGGDEIEELLMVLEAERPDQEAAKR